MRGRHEYFEDPTLTCKDLKEENLHFFDVMLKATKFHKYKVLLRISTKVVFEEHHQREELFFQF